MNKEEAIKELYNILLSLERGGAALAAVKKGYKDENEFVRAYLSGLDKEIEMGLDRTWFYVNQARNELKQDLRHVSKGERKLSPSHPGDAAIIDYMHSKIDETLAEGRKKAKEAKQ